MPHRLLPLLLVGLPLLLTAAARGADGETDRRKRREPGLILETGARTAACDALTFTADGKYLLAAGDDKVVRSWRVTEEGLVADKVLRWSAWREKRGSIYALALSPDERKVAVAGLGVRDGAVAILDRQSGSVQQAWPGSDEDNGEIRALAFAPSGTRVCWGARDGSLWLWDLEKKGPAIKLGRHRSPKRFNTVRLVAFLTGNVFLSVAQDGQVLRWDLQGNGRPEVVFTFKRAVNIARAALSPDKKWLAAVGDVSAPGKKTLDVELWPVEGDTSNTFTFDEEVFPHALAFDPRGKRLAVGVRHVPRGGGFFKVTRGRVVFLDLAGDEPRPDGQAIDVNYLPEAVAFSPSGRRLAVANGGDYEITLWDTARLGRGPVQVIRSPGSSLWGVALSDDGKTLAFQDQREKDPEHPNQRGRGPWRFFRLSDLRWAKPQESFRARPAEKSHGRWSVITDPAETHDAFRWEVESPGGKRLAIPLDRESDFMPLCYTFLPARDEGPVRLAVGHYWGFSVFELSEQGLRRTRLCVGHQGEVTALAASADGEVVVSASRDQTLAAWSLADWPSQPIFGVRCRRAGDRLFVAAVDRGSPAWEAGLAEDDEVVRLAFNGKEVKGGAADWDAVLRNPQPGREVYLEVLRQGKRLRIKTTVKQRPLWRFFPTRDGEWVLWRWFDYYYATSTNGDYYVGWQVIDDGDVGTTPAFYQAEKFRREFHRPDKVRAILQKKAFTDVDLERIELAEKEPPEVALRVLSGAEVKDGPVKLELRVTPRGALNGQQLREVELWVEQTRLQTWSPEAGPFRATAEVSAEQLAQGSNRFRLVAWNRAGSRNDASAEVTLVPRPLVRPQVHVIAVGVGDYGSSKPPLPALDYAPAETRALVEQLRGGTWKWCKLQEPVQLIDAKARRQAVLDGLRALEDRVKPDDLVILSLAGHGTGKEQILQLADDLNEAVAKDEKVEATSFFFCTADFDARRPNKTAVKAQALSEALARLKCRKVVVLNYTAARLATDPARELRPDDRGCYVIALTRDQADAERPRLPPALEEVFRQVSGDLESKPAASSDRGRVAEWVEKIGPLLRAELRKASGFRVSAQGPTDKAPAPAVIAAGG